MEYSLEIANLLRKESINSDMFLEDKKLKAKFKYADKLNIPYVIVIGEDEVKNRTATLKNMEIGEQESLSIDEIIKKLK